MYKNYALGGLVKCKECGSYMTPCHTNKDKKYKKRRYYYYRCTKTFHGDWNSCETKQINANRLEKFVFENLERISRDRHYIDSLIFRINNTRPGQIEHNSDSSNNHIKKPKSGSRIGLEPSQSCSESAQISPEIFAQTLSNFSKSFSLSLGLEKNFSAKIFIKEVVYSKEEIVLTLYYQRQLSGVGDVNSDVGSTYTANGRKIFLKMGKNKTPAFKGRGGRTDWLPGQDSNLRLGGYSYPQVSSRTGLSLCPRLYVRAAGV